MFELGIFAKTFSRPTLEATLDAVAAHGLRCVQFNMSCAGLPAFPESISSEMCERIARAHAERGLRIAAVSGTFNMIHTDRGTRADGFRRLRALLAACPLMGADVVTLCSGTRDPINMWRHHPGNVNYASWRELERSMREAAALAGEFGVSVAVEPELANVVDCAAKARHLLDAIGSARLKIVIDPANLFQAGQLPRMHEILEEAITWLRDDIMIAHAKDLDRDGAAGNVAAGKGKLDYDAYLRLLARHAPREPLPLILHGLAEDEVAGSVAFLKAKIKALGPIEPDSR